METFSYKLRDLSMHKITKMWSDGMEPCVILMTKETSRDLSLEVCGCDVKLLTYSGLKVIIDETLGYGDFQVFGKKL